MPQYPVLDGWRALSILCVLAGHMLPLGPKRFDLNGAVAAMGMSIFFTLSGFLITKTLIYRPNIVQFLIRRFCRILPLAWLFTLVALLIGHASLAAYPAHFLFYANIPPILLTETTGHLWSLCVEMQFYVTIACLFGMLGRRGLWGIPVLCLAVTAARVLTGTTTSIVTYVRADEILVGGCLALIDEGYWGARLRAITTRPNLLLLLPLLLGCLASKEAAGSYHIPAVILSSLAYLRPYLAAALVGGTLSAPGTLAARYLSSRRLQYLAHISFALYIVHPLTMHGWLGSGDTLVKYAKRPFGIALAFVIAHISTYTYEARWIVWGKRMAARSTASI